MLQKAKKKFPFLKNDVVLARYGSELYYAKILSINYKRKFAKLLFDDDSKEEISFRKIYSVNEETSDIICIICKKDRTEPDDDIVLCDKCNVGYHQMCHEPYIHSKVLKPEVPWECSYCTDGKPNPYISANPFEGSEEDCNEVESTEITSDEDDTENMETSEISDEQNNDSDVEMSKRCKEANEMKQLRNDDSFDINDEDRNIVVANADSTSTHVDRTIDIENNHQKSKQIDQLLQHNQPTEGDTTPSLVRRAESTSDDVSTTHTTKEKGEGVKQVLDNNNDIESIGRSITKELPKPTAEIRKPVPRRTSFVDPLYFDEALSLNGQTDTSSNGNRTAFTNVRQKQSFSPIRNHKYLQQIPEQKQSISNTSGANFNLNLSNQYEFTSQLCQSTQSSTATLPKAFTPPQILTLTPPEDLCNTQPHSPSDAAPSPISSPHFDEIHRQEECQHSILHRRNIRSHSFDHSRSRSHMNFNRKLSNCYAPGGVNKPSANTNLTFSTKPILSHEQSQNTRSYTNKPTSPFEKNYRGSLGIEVVAAQIKELEEHIQRQEEEIQARKALLRLNGIYEHDFGRKSHAQEGRMYSPISKEEEDYYARFNMSTVERDAYNETVVMSSEYQSRRNRLHSDSTLLLQDTCHYGKSRTHNELKRTFSHPFGSPAPSKRTRTSIMIPESYPIDQNNNDLFEATVSPHQLNDISRYHQTRAKPIRRSHSIELHREVYVKKSPSTRNHRCNKCNGPAEFLCGACRKTWYCTQRCQLTDWNQHLSKCDEH